MKTISAKLAALPDTVLIVLSIVATLLLVTVLVFLVIWPSVSSLGPLSEELKAEKAKVTLINESIALLSSQDKETLEEIVDFLNQYVPEKVDNLHFATLNEAVSNASGALVTNIQISKGASTPATAPAQPTTESPTAGSAPTQAASTAPVQAAPVTVEVTYSSNFDSLITLLSYWVLADQLVSLKEVNISGVSGGVINYTVSYRLPTSGPAQKATIEDRLSLTKQQKDKLLELKGKIIYTATPSANSVGKSNPFN